MNDEKETLDQETLDQETENQSEELDLPEDNENEEDKNDESESKKDIDSLTDEEFLDYLDEYYKSDSTHTKTHEEPKPDNKKNNDKSDDKIDNRSIKEGSDSSKNSNNNDPISEKPKSDPVLTDIDYKAEYEKIFKPFKANGKEISPKTVEDVVSLMQMGANYTKKMQLLSPYKKAVETLSKHNITDEDLSYLIDIKKGDKEAIKALLKESNIDLMDLDLDDVKYTKNKNNIATDSEVQFHDMLRDIHESLPQINDIMDNVWDEQSKKILLSDPKALRGLHEEIQMGRFNTIQEMVEREKTFGRYKDVPDIQLYSMIALEMSKQQQSQEAVQREKEQKQAERTKRTESKKRAGPTGKATTKSSSTLTVKDLLSMPEEEFLKLSEKNLV